MSVAWRVTARVARYGVPMGDDGQVLHPGCFSYSLAKWWIPAMGQHARHFYLGLACKYDDHDEALDVDFITADGILAEKILDGFSIEFSIGYGAEPGETNVVDADLREFSVIEPPRRGACPGTKVLGIVEVHDPALIEWCAPNPVPIPTKMRRRFFRRPPAPTPTMIQVGIRERYGRPRDDFDALEYWTREAERRELVGVRAEADELASFGIEVG